MVLAIGMYPHLLVLMIFSSRNVILFTSHFPKKSLFLYTEFKLKQRGFFSFVGLENGGKCLFNSFKTYKVNINLKVRFGSSGKIFEIVC